MLCGGEPIPLTAKAFDLLVTLVRHSGHLVSKDDLLRTVWPDTIVEEVNLTVNISALRKALGRGCNGKEVIQTVPTRGYRFVVPVKTRDEAVALELQDPSRGLRMQLPDQAPTACSVGYRKRGRIPRLSSRSPRLESEIGGGSEAGHRELPARRLH